MAARVARHLTTNEKEFMLKPVFGRTLWYDSIVCKVNVENLGGAGNSITMAGVPHFSSQLYCPDFFVAKKISHRWTFVHEIAHVWQWYHGIYPVFAALGIKIADPLKDYTDAYPYDLVAGKALTDYNIEQQASIIADYWALTNGLWAFKNNNSSAVLADYTALIGQLQHSGPPVLKLDEAPTF